MEQEREEAQRRGARGGLRRLLPLLVLLAAIIAFFALGLNRYLTFQALAENRDWLLATVARHGVIAPIVFIAVYAATVALSVPGATFLTVTSGFLFGIWLGGLYALIGANIGAATLFLIARTVAAAPKVSDLVEAVIRTLFGELFLCKLETTFHKLEAGFQENAASYLLILRLVPAFPFWLVNLGPALLGVPLGTFVLFSALGMVPGAFVYASVGSGLSTLIAAGQTPDLGIIFQWRVLGPLVALAVLAAIPIVYRWHKGRRRVSMP
jgi:uncharacterized membrane protein YdjX (TVP38/TMEM64 family)